MKTCTLCKIQKDTTEFCKKKSYPDGLSPWCKPCKRIKDSESYQKNKEKIKERAKCYYRVHKEQVLERRQNDDDIKQYNREYKRSNKEQTASYNKEYRERKKEDIKIQRREYRQDNKEKINTYTKEKLKTDPLFKLAKTLRKRLSSFIKDTGRSYNKRGSEEYLGCTLVELKKHIEKQFTSEMTWENHGSVWHLDHKIPLASAKTESQLYDLGRWSNIQPLSVRENLQKNSRLPTDVCWQKLQRDRLLEEDIKAGYPTNIKARDFTLSVERLSGEHRRFIERYEWLGTCGFGVRHVFTARFDGLLGGVVMIAEPNGYQFDKHLEALIQRGACASWTPKNLGSRLIMFACKWMINNTTKRIFSAYSDSDAGEIGTIYQACNFDYLGNTFGSGYSYKLQSGKLVGDRYFTRTSSMKKWAKELGIEWMPEWTKPNGFQNIKTIPNDIRDRLTDHAKLLKKQCEQIKINYKGKYVLLLCKPGEKLEKSWKPLPYPKRYIAKAA